LREIEWRNRGEKHDDTTSHCTWNSGRRERLGPRRDALTLRLVASPRVLSFLDLSAYTPHPIRVTAPALPTATEIAR
jgi:hypothetical protein